MRAIPKGWTGAAPYNGLPQVVSSHTSSIIVLLRVATLNYAFFLVFELLGSRQGSFARALAHVAPAP